MKNNKSFNTNASLSFFRTPRRRQSKLAVLAFVALSRQVITDSSLRPLLPAAPDKSARHPAQFAADEIQ